jgi:hypothetical protein
MTRYLAMQPLEFCGEVFKQNAYIDVADQPSDAEAREIERLVARRALRREKPEPSPVARDRAMEGEPSRQRGYKTRGK